MKRNQKDENVEIQRKNGIKKCKKYAKNGDDNDDRLK